MSNINKDTIIFGSFSLNAGNGGNIFFNNIFNILEINAIYKSFSISNIEDGVKAARCLNFGGFAISMPFKKDILNFVDELSDEVKYIGACNTVVNKNGKLIAYNTDYIAMKYIIMKKMKIHFDTIIEKINELQCNDTYSLDEIEKCWENSKKLDFKNDIYILGDGGMAAATKYALSQIYLKYNIINRNNWHEIETLKNKIIINCTPVKNIIFDKSNMFIDTLPESTDGKEIHEIQAKEQFKLYTGLKI